MHGCRQTGSHRSLFFRPAVCIFRKLRYLGIYVDFPGELVPEHIFFPCIQAETAGKRLPGQLWTGYRCWQVPRHSASSGKSSPKRKQNSQVYNKGLVLRALSAKRCSCLKQTVGADNHENHRREKGQKSIGSRIGGQRLHIAGSLTPPLPQQPPAIWFSVPVPLPCCFLKVLWGSLSIH